MAPIESVWQAWTARSDIESFFAPEAEVEPHPFELGRWWRVGQLARLKKFHETAPALAK